MPKTNSFLSNTLAARRVAQEQRVGLSNPQSSKVGPQEASVPNEVELGPQEDRVLDEIIDTTLPLLIDVVEGGLMSHDVEGNELGTLAPTIDEERIEIKKVRPQGEETILLFSGGEESRSQEGRVAEGKEEPSVNQVNKGIGEETGSPSGRLLKRTKRDGSQSSSKVQEEFSRLYSCIVYPLHFL